MPFWVLKSRFDTLLAGYHALGHSNAMLHMEVASLERQFDSMSKISQNQWPERHRLARKADDLTHEVSELRQQLADKETELTQRRAQLSEWNDWHAKPDTQHRIFGGGLSDAQGYGRAFVDDVERHRLAWANRYGKYAFTWIEQRRVADAIEDTPDKPIVSC